MSKHIHTLPKWVINFFFILGIVGAISFRILIFINKINPAYTKVVWYIGVLGYLFFFLFRYYISRKRRAAITNADLLRKIANHEKLSEEDVEITTYVFNSILKSKENLNYLVIFILSFIVIFLDLFVS